MTLPDVELPTPHVKTTQAVDILAFIDAQEIPFQYFGTPYRLAPVPGGEKLYELLCDELRRTSKIGIACVVIHARQHLAALTPQGQSLMLTTLRWMNESDAGDDARVTGDELGLASRMAMAVPHASGFDHDYMEATWHQAFQPGIPALEEQMMKDKKTAGILVEELDGLLDDDEFIDESYLTPALRRSAHPVNGYAIRAARKRGPHARNVRAASGLSALSALSGPSSGFAGRPAAGRRRRG